MKLPTNFYVMIVLLLFLSLSCNKEELFVEDLAQAEIIEETEKTEETEEANEDSDEQQEEEIDPTQPCDLSLEALVNDLTDNIVSINCFMDLEGKTINLPPNIAVKYEGGEIKNGTLVFSGGTIDSELLDISIELKGDVVLSTDTYTLVSSKWDIVEGKTTKEISLQNRENINQAIALVDRLEGHVFELTKIDAYFNVEANKVNREYSYKRSIRVPSNFHFKMNDDTFLRVQPTHFPAYALITTMVTDNAKISGGNLIGDRWEHDYSPINDIVGANRDEHGYGHVIWVIGAHNTIIDNVFVSQAIGEGIQIHSETIRDSNGELFAGTRTSENVVIKNCLVTECRRNNIAVVDAKGVLIENCEINDTGKGSQAYDASGNKIFSSAGTAPRYGIDLEALRYINDDGSMNEINKIDDVVIRNCSFRGNAAGDIDIYTVQNVIIENNYFDKWVANFAANDVVIRNNTFESRDPEITFGINIRSFVRNNREFNYNYQIYGNTIKGYKNGITVAGKNVSVNNNTITDCQVGIQLKGNANQLSFQGNTIKSDLPASFGYKCFNNSQNSYDLTMVNDFIDVTNRPLSFIGFNNEMSSNDIQVVFEGCTFNSKNKNNFFIHLNKAKHIEFKNNVSNTDFEIIDSENILLTNNAVKN
ncbi:right-handed parallel beta-helix repeat-containing protein [Tamlana crocina]|uniref:Right handed beta helix domain-containing protein n=1 Tax=Tamlana crocina TaxID=393006 RepID=A0ABX1DDL5_9FLAO|nr:right-handed parallel beta-helix repeat-containing protein [Tamlana crocina]NJX15164.1 hypothetical protein [Tamlana crocina]